MPLGPELLINGDAQTGDFTGWTEHTDPGTTIVSNEFVFTQQAVEQNIFLGQDFENTVGDMFRFGYTISDNIGEIGEDGFRFSLQSAFGNVSIPVTEGVHSVDLVSVNSETIRDFRLAMVGLSTEPSDSIVIDDMSLKKIIGEDGKNILYRVGGRNDQYAKTDGVDNNDHFGNGRNAIYVDDENIQYDES